MGSGIVCCRVDWLAAAETIERYCHDKGIVVSGHLQTVLSRLREQQRTFAWAIEGSGARPDRPVELVVRDSSREPDAQILTLTLGLFLGEALAHFEKAPGVQIDKTLVSREISRLDERVHGWCDGAFTVTFAFRLHRMVGGAMRLFGAGEKGRDILWTPPGAESVSIECKTRDWDAVWRGSASEAVRDLGKWIGSRIVEMESGLKWFSGVRVAVLHIPTNPQIANGLWDATTDLISPHLERAPSLHAIVLYPVEYSVTAGNRPTMASRGTLVEIRRPDQPSDAGFVAAMKALSVYFDMPPDRPVVYVEP